MSEELDVLPIAEIEATASTQVRVRIDPNTIDEYADDMKNGHIFPPVVVFAEAGSERYILADGFHRLAAAQKAKLTEIGVVIKEGGLHEALMAALEANAGNGLRRTNADKCHAVEMALKDPFLSGLPLREIAEVCRVSHELVRTIKQGQNKKTEPAAKVSTDDKESAGENVLATKTPPTQDEVDKAEFMAAVKVILSFPYTGLSAIEHMYLGRDELHDIDLAADWMDSCATGLQASIDDGEPEA
jgi:hypothetical protein